MVQQSLWGMDANGVLVSHGDRLVYFLLCHFRQRSLVKIGFTHRPLRYRVAKLGCGNPEFEVLGSIMVRDGIGDQNFHKRFHEWHYKGEWFHATPELLTAITALLADAKLLRVTTRSIVQHAGEWILFWACPTCKECLWSAWHVHEAGVINFRARCEHCASQMAIRMEIVIKPSNTNAGVPPAALAS